MDAENHQQLKVIETMIANAKGELQEDAFSYLLWGYLVLGAAVIHFSLMMLTNFPYPYLSWAVLMPLGGIVSLIYGYKEEKNRRVTTYIDKFLKFLWLGFVISLIIGILISAQYSWMAIFPIVMLVYGLALFVTGSIIQFKPLTVGGLINWLCALVAVFVPFVWQFALLGFAVIAGYIVPGHLLKSQKRG